MPLKHIQHVISDKVPDVDPELLKVVKKFDWTDVQVVLFKAETEDQESIQMGTYYVEGYGNFVYGGIQGTLSAVLCGMTVENHPVAKNIEQGSWLMDYHVERIRKYLDWQPNLADYLNWLTKSFEKIKKMPEEEHRFTDFAQIISDIYSAVGHHVGSTLFPELRGEIVDGKPTAPGLDEGGIKAILQLCALGGIQMVGRTASNSLFPVDYRVGIAPEVLGKNPTITPTMAAGLPHFSTNYMRQWGRDIFLSVPGLLLSGAQPCLDLAKACILSAGSIMRHGLIPNLIDSGRGPRYNARDAVWYWVYCVVLYYKAVEDLKPGSGKEWIDTIVLRRFVPTPEFQHPATLNTLGERITPNRPVNAKPDVFCHWDSPPAYSFQSTISQLVVEALTRHANGIHFRDPAPDHAMKEEGRQVDAFIDENGFAAGGSIFNCGTWMDKMGDASINRGHPATPRDGAPVEFQGLLYATLRWLQELVDKGIIAEKGVSFGTWGQWADKLKVTFVSKYLVPEGEAKNDSHPEFIFHKPIFKDTVGSAPAWPDYQLRPNFLISMVAAPDMCDQDTLEGKNICRAILKQAVAHLLTPMGMRTLSDKDSAYRPYYLPGDESSFETAHGLNYHQGPAWQWPLGFFLRAYNLWFLGSRSQGVSEEDKAEAVKVINGVVGALKTYLMSWTTVNPWAGLPELQQGDGTFCAGSSPTQSWSLATMVEACLDLLE